MKAFWNLDTGRSGAQWADFVIITHKLCSANKKATGGGGGVCVGERGWGGNRCIMSAHLKKNKCSPSLVCVSLILCPFAFSLPPPLTLTISNACPRETVQSPLEDTPCPFLPVYAPHERKRNFRRNPVSSAETPSGFCVFPHSFSFCLRECSVCNTGQLQGKKKRCRELQWAVSYPALIVLLSPA